MNATMDSIFERGYYLKYQVIDEKITLDKNVAQQVAPYCLDVTHATTVRLRIRINALQTMKRTTTLSLSPPTNTKS